MIELIGWIGVFFGIFVAPTQLIRILRTKETRGISRITYTFLCAAMVCYLIHAINIKDPVFITAQTINLTVNSAILMLLLKGDKSEADTRR